MRLVAGFDFVNGTGHLREQGGTFGIIPVGELSGETFYARELAVFVPAVADLVIEGDRLTIRADKMDAFGLAELGVGAADLVADGVCLRIMLEHDGFLHDLTTQVVGEFARSGGVGDFGDTTVGVVFVSDDRAVGGSGLGELQGRGIVGVAGSYFERSFRAISCFAVLLSRDGRIRIQILL
jgi:hypothetical protein